MTTRLTPDICVIGAGSGGLSVAAAAAAFGAPVVLIERGKMGGDCLNYGCVPSKALLAAAKRAQAVREAPAFGVMADPDLAINFPKGDGACEGDDRRHRAERFKAALHGAGRDGDHRACPVH